MFRLKVDLNTLVMSFGLNLLELVILMATRYHNYKVRRQHEVLSSPTSPFISPFFPLPSSFFSRDPYCGVYLNAYSIGKDMCASSMSLSIFYGLRLCTCSIVCISVCIFYGPCLCTCSIVYVSAHVLSSMSLHMFYRLCLCASSITNPRARVYQSEMAREQDSRRGRRQSRRR